jgi:hypothetical protein
MKEELDHFLVERQRRLNSQTEGVSSKAIALVEIRAYLDFNLSEKKKDTQCKLLDESVQNLLDDYWTDLNRSVGHGTFNGLWVPKLEFVPQKNAYSNMNNMSWREILRKYNINGIRFEDGTPVFKELKDVKCVQMNDFAEFIDAAKPDIRTRLHDEAFKRLARNSDKSLAEVICWKNNNVYVWHEELDCKTLYLVPREIHDNISHVGGIGLLKILRKNRFV